MKEIDRMGVYNNRKKICHIDILCNLEYAVIRLDIRGYVKEKCPNEKVSAIL